MPHRLYALILVSVILAGGITAALLALLPPSLAAWLVPVLMAAAVSVRLALRRD